MRLESSGAEVRARLERHQLELDNTRHELAAKHRRHTEELGKLHGLNGRVEAVCTRHDALAQTVALHKVEAMRHGGEAAQALEKVQQAHTALDGAVEERCQQALRRSEQIMAMLDETKSQIAVGFSQQKQQLEDTERNITSHAKRLNELEDRIGQLAGIAKTTEQHLQASDRDRGAADDSAKKALEAVQAQFVTKLSDQDKTHREQVQEAEAMSRDLFAQHVGMTKQAAKRTDKLSVALERTDRDIRLEISTCVGDMHRKLGAIEGQHVAHGYRLESLHISINDMVGLTQKSHASHLSALAQRIPQVEAEQANLKGRLDDIVTGTKLQVDDHLRSAKSQMEKRTAEHLERMDQRVSRSLGGVQTRADSHEQKLSEQLAVAARLMQQVMEHETDGARQVLSNMLLEAHEDLSNLRAVWVPDAHDMASEAMKAMCRERQCTCQRYVPTQHRRRDLRAA